MKVGCGRGKAPLVAIINPVFPLILASCAAHSRIKAGNIPQDLIDFLVCSLKCSAQSMCALVGSLEHGAGSLLTVKLT